MIGPTTTELMSLLFSILVLVFCPRGHSRLAVDVDVGEKRETRVRLEKSFGIMLSSSCPSPPSLVSCWSVDLVKPRPRACGSQKDD